MRIALVSLEVAGFRGGGIGTYVVEAGHALKAAGHDVTLVTSAPADPADRERLRALDDFTRVAFVEEAGDPEGPTRFAVARDTFRFAHLAHRTLCREVEGTHGGAPFDYVEFPDYQALGYVTVLEHRLLGTFPETVVAVVLHSPSQECLKYDDALHSVPPGARELVLLEDETIRTAANLWSPSTRLAELVAERLGTLGPGGAGTRIIRYPMRLAAALPPAPRRVSRLADLRFLYFGRIEPRKGVRALVEAFARLPDLQIDLVGRDLPTSPYGTSETDWLSRHDAPNVRFHGPLPRAQMLQRLADADVVVLPSPWENWPNTCIEAMAAGRVVVGGRHGGMGEMIEHGVSGFLCDGALADDIARVIEQDVGAALDRLDAIGAAAHARIRELSDPARYVAAIERLVAEWRPQPPAPGKAKAGATTAATAAGPPLVTIVTPFYREPREMIAEAVGSAIAQTARELEILVIDDGSPRADADEILAHVAGLDPRVRVVRKANGGLASARNLAVEQARGDHVLLLDADNRLRPDYVELALRAFARDETIDVVVPWFRVFGASPRAGTTFAPVPFHLSLALVRNAFGDAGAMFRARVFREHGLRFDPLVDVYSDWALWLDCARKALRVQRLPRVLYDYRVREGSLMDEQSWDRHVHLVGLLIDRHLPIDDPEVRDMLVTLTRAWGAGALLAALGGRPEYADRGHRMVDGFRPGSVRYRVADAIAKAAGAVPGVRPLVRALFGRLERLHGRFKDRRTEG